MAEWIPGENLPALSNRKGSGFRRSSIDGGNDIVKQMLGNLHVKLSSLSPELRQCLASELSPTRERNTAQCRSAEQLGARLLCMTRWSAQRFFEQFKKKGAAFGVVDEDVDMQRTAFGVEPISLPCVEFEPLPMDVDSGGHSSDSPDR